MQILVVGMGLIGGSICKSIKASTEHTVFGCDVQQSVLEDAIKEGAIDGIGTMNDGTYDMIIICLHQRIAIQLVQEALPQLPPGTILVDTCGLKGRMVRDLTYRCRKSGVHYVGTHPMAGREKSGYYASIPDLFQNANLIVTPVDGTDETALEAVKQLAKQMGFGNIVTATPMWHDNMIAYTSQLAHVVSSAYVKDFCMDDALSFSGGSFQDMTRVATMDESMWSALFLDNRDNLLYHLDLLIENLTDYRDALKQRDEERLQYLIAEGRQIQEENVRKRKEMNEK
ncbi:prephenate dehydrogenase/arogenate dehydrogenase family protein [uncultured Ruminococcus sp.]|uniref:prephenate dehydrogenase n=1 Tax=uncultured Ruminococcus sp. TaxID=165186 RepID=UPI002618E59B|nr:prephenate dehydrogenase/arogenate dehydrogenase family protein [uncultured Ruminococcus sp.]